MVLLLEIVVVAAVVFAVAGFISGWIPGMRPVEPDVTDNGLPEGRLGPRDVDRTRFGLAFRGYRMNEVDTVLDRLRDQLADHQAELAALREAASAHGGETFTPDERTADLPDEHADA